MRSIRLPLNLIRAAYNEASYSNVKRAKLSAIGLNDQLTRILSKSHNVCVWGNPTCWTLHAEERLLIKYRRPIPSLLVVRLNGNGDSKPCEKCMERIKLAGVKSVIFSVDGFFYSMRV